MMTTSPPAAGALPAAAPPGLRKSLDLSSDVLPQPTTVRRATLRLAGRTISSAVPLLPVKRSAAAARDTTSAALPSILRVAAPSLRESLQNTTSTPFDGIRNRANPSFTSFAMAMSLPAGDLADRSVADQGSARHGSHRPDPAASPLPSLGLPSPNRSIPARPRA